MKKWVCTVCGYVHEGDTAPEKCPTCGVPAEKFKEQTGDREWAAEHVVGVAQGASEDISAAPAALLRYKVKVLKNLKKPLTGKNTDDIIISTRKQ